MRSNGIVRKARGAGISCLTVLLLVMFSSHLWAYTLSAQGSLLINIQNLASQDESTDIQVEIKEGTLCQALKVLEKKVHGSYTCPESLNQIKVQPRTIRGFTWHSIVSQLLSDYNTIILWENDTKLKSIHLLGFAPEATEDIQVTPALNQVTHPLNNDEMFLSAISKLRTQWANAPLSEELFNHPGFQDIFKTAGINSPEDWKNPKKQSLAKRELTKLYEITRQKLNNTKE
jgi:hypothetical protein